MSLWEKCQGEKHLAPLKADAWRVVEAQHLSTTRKLVDSLDEHELLETLIEQNKPIIKQTHQLHYLLFTPFRYPPLQHGSRFSGHFEPSLWYGSLQLETAFAECAYYRFLFLAGSSANITDISIRLTAFQANIKTENGIDLTHSPFNQHKKQLASPTHYETTQQLGNSMRQAGVEAFIYYSARTVKLEKNIGLFSPKAFLKKQPLKHSLQNWQCFIDETQVEFTRHTLMGNEKHIFPKTQYLVNGKLPAPAP